MEQKYKFYTFEGVFEIPPTVDMLELTTALVEVIERFGCYMGGGFVEVDEDGNEVLGPIIRAI